MNIKEMIKVVLPTIYKKDIVDVLYNAHKEIQDTNIPIYEDADQMFKTWEFKSNEVNRLVPIFNKIVSDRKGNMITSVKYTLDNMVKMIEEAKPAIERNFNDANAQSALSFRKAQYLQFVEATKWYIEYSRLFANYVIIAETGKYDMGNTINKRMTPAQISRVEKGFVNFAQLTNVFNGSIGNVIGLLDKIPDILIVPENIDMVESSLGKDRLDPLKMNFISATSTPFFTIQVRRALRDHQRYEKAIEERELLKLRLLNLRRSSEGNPDPKVQKQIEYFESSIAKLDFKIKEDEKEYA